MHPLLKLQQEIAACRLCHHTFGFEPKPMVWGKPHAPIVLVGQAPSKKVHETGKPFNDQSGKRLRRWLGVTNTEFYNQNLFYITATGHCFPGKSDRKGGGDKKPPALCADLWLQKEVELLTPHVFLLIGASAAFFFFGKKPLQELVFAEGLVINNRPAFVMPHPSPLNIKWFKDYPEFEARRVEEIRQIVNDTLS